MPKKRIFNENQKNNSKKEFFYWEENRLTDIVKSENLKAKNTPMTKFL